MKLGFGPGRGEPTKGFRRLGRRFLRLARVRSFLWSDGFWWYRWHSDAGIGFLEKWEEAIERYILRSGASFVDAGAHVGRWTLRASRFYERVIAFEPDPLTNYVLRRNIARNSIKNILVFATALSNHRDQALLFNYGTPACNSLRNAHVSGRIARGSKTVQVRLLDDFVSYFRAPMVLKIDVEGEELRVLEGASATLEKFRPMIVMEIHFQDDIGRITEEMNLHGYRITELVQYGSEPCGLVHMVANPGNQ